MKQTLIVDSTLREGEQTPGILITPRQKMTIACELIEAGVTDLEAGIPAMGEQDTDLLRDLGRLSQSESVRVINWCRTVDSDIEAARTTGTGAIHISLPVSSRQLTLMKKEWSWVREQLCRRGEFLKKDFDFISVGAMDASRTSEKRIKEFVSTAGAAGFHRIRLADTVGIMSPLDIRNWAELLEDYLPLLEFHGHNDLAMAVANTVTAMDCGFGAVSATLLGLGERAGNAPLEEILLAAQVRGQGLNSLSLKKIAALAVKTAGILGETISPAKPLLGSRIHKHESGIHVAGLKKDPKSFKPYDPARYGLGEEEYIWGRQSGRSGLKDHLSQFGIEAKEHELNILLTLVRRVSQEKGGSLDSPSIVKLYREVTALYPDFSIKNRVS